LQAEPSGHLAASTFLPFSGGSIQRRLDAPGSAVASHRLRDSARRVLGAAGSKPEGEHQQAYAESQ
jgi:hypothetical protein